MYVERPIIDAPVHVRGTRCIVQYCVHVDARAWEIERIRFDAE